MKHKVKVQVPVEKRRTLRNKENRHGDAHDRGGRQNVQEDVAGKEKSPVQHRGDDAVRAIFDEWDD